MILMNNLRVPLFAGAGAISIGVLCFLLFFLSAGGSRGAWTALAGVVAAAGALAINLVFDLNGGSKEITTITAEYTFDRAVPQIRQWLYARSLGARYATEVLANNAVLQADPHILDRDAEKSTKDVLLFSLTAYLEVRQHDWQEQRERYTPSSGRLTMGQYLSNPANLKQCTRITEDEIQKILKKAGNIFAAFTLPLSIVHFPYLCLPPQSSLRMGDSSLTLTNPFSRITFFIPELFIELTKTYPGSHTADIPMLSNGKPRFETRVMGLQVIRKMSGLMTQHPDFSKYEEWSKGVVDGARTWFETKAADESGPPWFGDDGEGDGRMFWTGVQLGGTEQQRQIWVQGSKVYDHQPP
jgi:hypothetical protein